MICHCGFSQMANDIEHLFTCLSVICIFSDEMFVHIFCLFSNWIISLLLSSESSLCLVAVSTLLDM